MESVPIVSIKSIQMKRFSAVGDNADDPPDRRHGHAQLHSVCIHILPAMMTIIDENKEHAMDVEGLGMIVKNKRKAVSLHSDRG